LSGEEGGVMWPFPPDPVQLSGIAAIDDRPVFVLGYPDVCWTRDPVIVECERPKRWALCGFAPTPLEVGRAFLRAARRKRGSNG
jgi:hypothetical protein